MGARELGNGEKLVMTTSCLYTPAPKAFIMSRSNGISVSRMSAKRRPGLKTPVKRKASWQKELDRFVKRYGCKLDPDEVNRLLHERFGD